MAGQVGAQLHIARLSTSETFWFKLNELKSNLEAIEGTNEIILEERSSYAEKRKKTIERFREN